MRDWLQTTSARGDDVAGRLEVMAAEMEHNRQGLSRAISALSSRLPDAAPLDGSDAFTLDRFDAGLGGQVVGFRGAAADAGAEVYVAFEDFFRGSEELIRERQLAYMPLLSDHGPVLDIGCGRGEMLELLRDRGIEAAGVDLDPAMVEHCRDKGLERVQVADAVDYLEATEAGSLGAVFAAQVIEHLPYPSLLRFLRASRRALAPSGLLVAETVNPHAPQALKHFWIDPTHQHPLFPEVMVALCRLTGFAAAFVWHPQGSGDPDRDRAEQLDYAVVAEAPPAARTGSGAM
jgi:SAM-dependent methyltransferase